MSKKTKYRKPKSKATPVAMRKVKVQVFLPWWAVSCLQTSTDGKGPLDSDMARGRTVSALIAHLLIMGPLAEHDPSTEKTRRNILTINRGDLPAAQ